MTSAADRGSRPLHETGSCPNGLPRSVRAAARISSSAVSVKQGPDQGSGGGEHLDVHLGPAPPRGRVQTLKGMERPDIERAEST